MEKAKNMKKLLAVLSILMTTGAFAQSAAQLQAQLGGQKVKKWGVILTNTISSSVREPSDYNSRIDNNTTGIYRYKLPWFNLRFLLSGSKDLIGARQSRFTTAFVEASSVVSSLSNKSVTTLFQGRFTPAVNDERRRNESHRGAYSGGLLFIVRPGHPQFQLIGIARATKNIHEFQINRAGAQNVSHSLMNYYAASFFPKDKWEVSAYVTNFFTWDYKGARKDNQTIIGQSLSYNLNKALLGTVGHEIGGYTYGVDGNNLDVSLYDTNSSSVYASLTFNY